MASLRSKVVNAVIRRTSKRRLSGAVLDALIDPCGIGSTRSVLEPP
jgi:hypothetical protein